MKIAITDEFADAYAAAFAQSHGHNETMFMAATAVAAAHARSLGHTPLRQGVMLECPRCGCTASIWRGGDGDLECIGALVEDRCP